MYKDKKYRTLVNGKAPFLYNCYMNMMQRCYNPNSAKFSDYGSRGIKVEPFLQKWTNYADYAHEIVPEGYTIKDMQRLHMSLDRINNDGNYERGNMHWETKKGQSLNCRIKKSNTSGYLGVHWRKREKKWQALIRIDGKRKHLGFFDLPEEAFDAYQKAYLKHHGPEAHTRMMERQKKRCEELGLKLKEYQ